MAEEETYIESELKLTQKQRRNLARQSDSVKQLEAHCEELRKQVSDKQARISGLEQRLKTWRKKCRTMYPNAD